MSDSDLSTASESGIPFEEVNCSGIKIETEVDLQPENKYELEQTLASNFKNENLQPNSGNECAIEKLLQRPFSTLSYQEKVFYVENDRPTESLNGLFKPSKGRRSFTRHFNTKSYDTVPWLSGCNRLGKLFCWPCLLFCPVKNVWNFFGYEDLNHFHAAVKRHRMSSHHITSFKELKQFVKMKIDFCLSSQFQIPVPADNIEVKKNRKVLGYMIKAVCFLAKEGLLTSHGKNINVGSYVELLNEFSEYDSDLKTFLINSSHFPVFLTDTLELLIASVCELMASKIKEKVSESPCISVILDRFADKDKSLLSTSIRYVSKDGNVRETFLGFKHFNKDPKAKIVALHMLEHLHKFGCEKKLVAYSLDGGVLTPSEYCELETQMKSIIPTAQFENYFAHALDVVVSQSLGFTKNCKIFFSNLLTFESFFKKTSERLCFEFNEKIPIHSLSWEYSGRLVKTLQAYQADVVNVLLSVISNAEKWDSETVCTARGLQRVLEDFEFNFLLEIFSNIFNEIDKLCGLLQKGVGDVSAFDKKMGNFKTAMSQLEEDFEDIWSRCRRVKCEPEEEQPLRKMVRVDTIPAEDTASTYKELLSEIVEGVVMNVQYRLDRLPGLKFTNLLDGKRFEKYKTKFPSSQFKALRASYEKQFDFEALKGELTVVCLDKEMHKSNVAELIAYLVSADLVEIFPEVLKLGALILTIPTFVAPEEGSVSLRVAAHARNAKGVERSQTLATLTVEKELLSELRNSPTFTDDVIDIFSQKNPNISLVLRN